MKTAIVRTPGQRLEACELTFVGRRPIDAVLAARQHHDYVAAMREAGVRVIVIPPDDDLPDSAFVEDCAVVLDELAVVTRPGAVTRRIETVAVEEAIAPFRDRISRIAAPGTLDGGDVLRVGRQLFVGISTRTNSDGLSQLAAIAGPSGYQVVPVGVRGSLHLKTAATALDDRTVLINPDWVDAGAFQSFQRLNVAEPFGANTLRIGTTLLVSSSHTETNRMLDAAGYRLRRLDISELEKAEAGLTCLSLVWQQ